MNLAQYINRTIFACVPALHEDRQAHPFKLVGVEVNGLWLEGEEFSQGLTQPDGADAANGTAVAFVPLAQIAYVLGAASTLSPPEVGKLLEEAKKLQSRPKRVAKADDARGAATKAPPKPKGS